MLPASKRRKNIRRGVDMGQRSGSVIFRNVWIIGQGLGRLFTNILRVAFENRRQAK